MKNDRQSDLESFPAKLRFVHVSNVHFDAPRDPVQFQEDDEERLPSAWEISFEVAQAGPRKYLATLTVQATFDSGKGTQADLFADTEGQHRETAPPYELSVSIRGGISVQDDVDDDFVTQWLEEGAQYLLFPYLRSVISDFLGQTGFPRAYFPLLSVPVFTKRESGGITHTP